MQEYVIYTYGGGDLLFQVFDAIGRIFRSNSDYLTPVGQLGMTVGALYAGGRAIVGGDVFGFTKSYLLPSMVTFLLLFSPKTTVWIKDEVEMNAPVKVDNIPFGISMITSLGSTMAHSLSKLLEENMMPANVNVSGTRTGILYGAKAVAKLRDVQIANPVLLRNTKEYMRQCYMRPYIMGNFGGRREAAQKSKDILSYLHENPAKCFGIKPIYSNGEVGKFMTCTNASGFIKQQIANHAKEPVWMGRLASSLGLATNNREAVNQRLKAMTSGTLEYLHQEQLDINKWMEQAMVLNANRESYDDWREKVGHPRVYPELVKMQATRGMFHQAIGSIIGAEMSEAMLPASLQPIVLSLFVMCFVIILPFAMLPGGWNHIMTGIKLMLWPTTWPIFYTIIHAISMYQLKQGIGAADLDGLSLLGQGAFTELVLMRYATAQALISSVPFISFAIVFGSPYAFSSLAGAIGGVSASQNLGAQSADGNINMNNVNRNNETINQQNVGGSLDLSHRYNDGTTSVITSSGSAIDGSGNNQIIHQHQDQLATNYNETDSIISADSENLSNAKSNLKSLTGRESNQTSLVNGQTIDVAKNVVKGTTTASNFTTTDQDSLRTGFSQTSSTKTGDSVVNSNNTGTSSNVGVGIPGGGAFGVSGGTSTNASNNLEVRSDMTKEEQQAFNKALDKLKTAASSDSLTTTNQEDQRLNESFSSNLSSLKQIGEEKAKTIQDIDTYQQNISYTEQNAGTINRNLNNEVMEKVREAHPELKTKEQTAKWMTNNRQETDAIAAGVIANHNPFKSRDNAERVSQIKENAESAQNIKIATPSSLEESYAEKANKAREQQGHTATTNTPKTIEKDAKEGAENDNPWYNKDVGGILREGLSDEEQVMYDNLKNEEKGGKGTVAKTTQDTIKNLQDSTPNSTAIRTLKEAGDNAVDVAEKIEGQNFRGLTGLGDTTKVTMDKGSENIKNKLKEYRKLENPEDKNKKEENK